jgi:predicted ATPase
MKIIPLVLDVEVRMAGNEMSETITAAKRALRELGIAIPDRVYIPKFMLKLRKVRRMIRGKDDEYILGLPIVQDFTKTTTMKLLTHLSLYLFFQGEAMMAFYSVLLATELMMQKGGGLSSFSATCVTTYAIVEMGMNNIHFGAKLGELAMKLNSRIPCNDTMCPMVSLNVPFLLHWKRQIHELEPILANAMKCGLNAGDVVYGSRCVANSFAFRVMMGENLESMEDCMRTIYHRLCEQGQTEMIRWTQPVMQYVLNMRSSPTTWRDLTMLSGEIMDESEYMSMALGTNHRIMLTQAWTYKSLLAYLFGNYEMAATIYEIYGACCSTLSTLVLLRCHITFMVP